MVVLFAAPLLCAHLIHNQGTQAFEMRGKQAFSPAATGA
jgi:hypothetical protein